MAMLEKGSYFSPEIVSDLISKVRGKSSLALLSSQEPIPFNGQKEFIFTMDNEIDVVAENGKKTHGGITIDPVTVVPIKVEYGARISDEFLYASEEEQLNILKSFNDGYAKKLAKGFDIMAMHGINPRTNTASAVIGTNHFDSKVTQTVLYTEADPDANIEAAVAMVEGSNGEINGMVMSNIFRSALAKIKANGVPRYPELAWGSCPPILNGLNTGANITVSAGSSKDRAILGDFANMFKWGFAKDIPLEIIKYGDPDNSGKDLKGYNQVYLRSETYLGWAILAPEHFVRIIIS